MNSNLKMGAIAGFAASIAVAVLDLVNKFVLANVTEFPLLLTRMMQLPDSMEWIGWIAHVVMGTVVLGPAFAYLYPRLPTDTSGTKGILFSVGAWILMMLTVAPLAGLGVFAGRAGFPTIGWMLLLHIVFGVVLGTVYGELRKKARAAERAAGEPAAV